MASKFTFIVSMPDEGPTRHDLEGDKVTFGRGPDNDIQVLVSEVSVKHGEFVADGDGFKIADNGSTNGTKVNGVKIDSSGKDLEAMDKVLLGETIECYFVATPVLEASEMSELIKDIDAKATKTGTAPIAVASPAGGGAAPAPVKPAPVTPGGPPQPAAARPAPLAPGAAKPAPVAPAAAKPAPVQPAQPAAPNPGAATVKLDQVRPSAGGGPAQPPKPAVPAGVKPPTAAPAPPAGVKPPAPGGAPAPQPVSPTPLKRPDAPSGGAAPPKIPLPGKKDEE